MPRYLIVVIIAAIGGFFLYGLLRSVLGAGPMLVVSLVILVVVGVIVWRNLQLNRKVADATPEQRAAALAFAADAGKAALYVYRNQFVGKAVGVNVDVDGRQAAQVKSPRFTCIALTPGLHGLELYLGTPAQKKPGAYAEELNVAVGDVVIVKIEIEPQMVGTVIKATRADAEKARREIGSAKMVAPDVGEV